jgi:hypothetical protein
MSERFPPVTGKNLNKETLTIPDDYNEKNLLAIVAFQQWHQKVVDDMIAIFEASNLDRNHSIIEVPVIQRSTKFRQIRLDTLMRVAIRDRRIRQRTVTVYIDKQAFREKLNIPDDNSVHWFLIDHVSKNILLRGTDTVSPEEITQISSHSN